MKTLIKGGRVIDPKNNLDEVCDILVEGSKIFKVAKNIKTEANDIIDATNKIVMPGIVDMHVHLREPGREDKETVASGTKAALKGGVTSVLAMPNTNPPMDSPENIKQLKDIINRTANANVFICGTITKARLGKELTDIKALKNAGACAISDDGSSVDSEVLMLEALKLAKEENIPLVSHCEDKALSNRGVVNLGSTSTRLGLRGIPKESEYKRVERDINLAEKAGAKIHIAHISCKESLDLIAAAKKRKAKVTCDTAPHYFALTEDAVLGYDTNMKMNPPLRGSIDKAEIRSALKNGLIDAIASDHAPHTKNEKDIEFEYAEFGVIGLETILSVSITELLNTGLMTWIELSKKLSLNPAGILGIDKGSLEAGKEADIIIVSPEIGWTVSKSSLISKSKNSSFIGRSLSGIVNCTLYSGKIAYQG